MPPPLTVKEAAAHATVSEGLIRTWLKEGLPHLRLGAKGKRGKVLIEVEDLDSFMAGFKVTRQVKPAPRPAKPIKLRHLHLPS